MFNNLSDRLTSTFRNLRTRGRLSEADVDATVREIRRALLDADVSVPVVRQFTSAVRERALGAEVSGALNPAQQVVKIVNDELVAILGGSTRTLTFAKRPPTVILLAGLQGIPQHLYEAMDVDGGGKWAKFRHVTWPLLAPTTFFILVISIINRFKIFATIHTMTRGGPADATEVIVFFLYEQAFQYFKIGYAFAVAYLLFVIIFSLTLIQWKIGKKAVHYQ